MTIRTAQLRLKFGFVERDARRRAGLAADRGQRAAQQSRRAPLGTIGSERDLHDALAPAALRHEHFVLGVLKMLVNQLVPLLQTHGVILPDAEALFLMRADHVAHQVSEQSPVVQAALPRLHGVVVRTAIETQASSMRFSGSSANRNVPPGASTRFTSRNTLSMFMNWLSI